MRVGIFGGTLNPIHYGHLRCAEEAREKFNLDSIWFIPAARPPHKPSIGLASFHHRMKMVQIAIRRNKHFKVLDIENRRKGYSFTIDTLKEAKAMLKHNDELFFIMGSDAFLDIGQWKDYSDFPTFTNIIVMGRNGGDRSEVREKISQLFPCHRERKQDGYYTRADKGSIILMDVTNIDISSTEIRNKRKKGESITYLLPREVEEYMNEHTLYTKHTDKESRPPVQSPYDTEQIAKTIAKEIHDNKGEDIVVMDVRGISAFADFLIIAHGRSSRHVQGIMSKMRKRLSRKKIKCKSIEGEDEGKWILMDYDDCIVHLFYEPVREFYDLEGLWHEAPRLEWQ